MSALPAPAETFKTERDIAYLIDQMVERQASELYRFIESYRAYDESDGRLAGVGVFRARCIEDHRESVREMLVRRLDKRVAEWL
jgi:hypothetical protein